MTHPTYRLFWLQENGCDAGTSVDAVELPRPVRDRIVALTENEPIEFHIRMPFMDRRDRRRQEAFLSGMPFERVGNLIRPVLDAAAATRDFAATLVLTDPVWMDTPSEREPEHFQTWQRVSVALQRWLRQTVAEEYFRDRETLRDRPNAYPVIVYQSSRPFFGHPRTEFTYDLRDYPWCDDTLQDSWKMVGRSMQRSLAGYEARLLEAGETTLAHRYSPVWHEDVLIAVKRKPKPYADLLAKESMVLNDLIDMGTARSIDSINRFAKTLSRTMRKVHGKDMRHLGIGLLEEATRVLDRGGELDNPYPGQASAEDGASDTGNVIGIGSRQTANASSRNGASEKIAA